MLSCNDLSSNLMDTPSVHIDRCPKHGPKSCNEPYCTATV